MDRLKSHSKEKVTLYVKYLGAYINILLSSSFRQVTIIEPFAGKGKYGNDDGSAVQANDLILKLREKFSEKKILHLLNDNDEKNFNSLKENLDGREDVDIENCDAKKFIASVLLREDVKPHKQLWFIDPYGYTQVRKGDIDNILRNKNSEVILFLPTSFIYRFIGGDLEDDKLSSIADFLADYEVNDSIINQCNDATDFSEAIVRKIQSRKVYSWYTTTQSGSNIFSIIFLGNHYYGLEKFLEAAKNIQPVQLVLFKDLDVLVKDPDFEMSLLDYLAKERNNLDLYKWGLQNGKLPSYMNKLLKKMEGDNKIKVKAVGGKKRRKHTFYLSHQYEKNKTIRIGVIKNG